METTEKKPLWLDVKKEYIDVNIDRLQEYLANLSTEEKTNDSFYKKTLSLLKERVQDFIRQIVQEKLFDELDISNANLKIRLFCMYLLSDIDSEISIPVFLALIRELQKIKPENSEVLVRACEKCLSHTKIKTMGITWQDLNDITTDLFTHKIANNTEFESPIERPSYYSSKGNIVNNLDCLYITDDNLDEAIDLINRKRYAVETKSGNLKIVSKSFFLKKDDCHDVEKIDVFTDRFIGCLSSKEKKQIVKVQNYRIGQEVIVEVMYVDKNNKIYAKTTDPNYAELKGFVKCKRIGFYGYDTTKFYQHFKMGDFVQATIMENTETQEIFFDIEESLREYVDNIVRNSESNEVFAKLVKTDSYNEDLWLSEDGIPVYTNKSHTAQKGDCAWISDFECGKGSYKGHIKASLKTIDDNKMPFDEKKARDTFVSDFAHLQAAPHYYKENVDFDFIEPNILKLVLQLYYNYQRNIKNAVERFKILSILNILSEAICEDLSSSFIRFSRKYFLTVIQFAQNEDIDNVILEPEEDYKGTKAIRLRIAILLLLKEYSKKNMCSKNQLINIDSIVREEMNYQDEEQQTLLRNLSSLIKASIFIKRTKKERDENGINFVDYSIRQQIVNLLSANTEIGVKVNEVCDSLGYESQTMEHKRSFIFPPKGKKDQPFEIYRSICGFLNSMCEGKLNIGVEDYYGVPVGYSEDIETLHKKYPDYFKSDDDVDAYMRFIQDEGIKRFGRIGKLLFSSYINFAPKILNRKKYLEISITPYPFGLVELDGKIYLRTNCATNEVIDSYEKQMILQQKIFSNRHSTNCLLKLYSAYNDKKRVVIKNYRSSNSNTIKDRVVECFQFFPDQKMVICYEIETKKNKGFNIDRMGDIQIMEDNWEFEDKHIEQNIDVFNMVGGSPTMVSLQIKDWFAKNQLIEEYPKSKDFIEKDGNCWCFKTEVGKIEGIGRFFMSVADHVDIIDAPELKNYISEYTKKYLLKYVNE